MSRGRKIRPSCWFALALALVAACDGPEPQTRKRHVADYLQSLLIEQRWAEWSEHFDPQASINGSDFALQIMRGTANGLQHSFSGLTLEIVEQVEEGDSVATFFVLRGRHERPFDAQPATGRSVSLDGFVIDRFSGERVVQSRMYLDVLGLSRRVAAGGAVPAAPEPTD